MRISGSLGGVIVLVIIFGISYGICSWLIETVFKLMRKDQNSKSVLWISVVMAIIVTGLSCLFILKM